MAARITPLVVVLGATGAGKSKLAIEIAKIFNGEIISADSMQIYKGLDIITNKVTEEEQRECKHHLISYLEPNNQNNTVVDFRNRALPVNVEDLLCHKKVPIIVGGTNYYIESLLWDFLVDAKGPGQVSPSTVGIDSFPSPASGIVHEPSLPKKIKVTSSSVEDDFIDASSPTPRSRPVQTISCLGEKTWSASHVAGSANESSKDIRLVDQTDGIARVNSLNPTSHQVDQSPSSEQHQDKSQESDSRNVRQSIILKNASDATEYDLASTQTSETSNWGQIQNHHGGTSRDRDGPPSRDEKVVLDWLNSHTTPDLYDKLQLLDSDTAHKHHPHNRRKIIRSLQVYYQTGRPMSDLLKEQHKGQGDANVKSGPLRYPDTCILWVTCQRQVLDERLDSRVDDMIARGLLKELEDFNAQAKGMVQDDLAESAPSQDYQHGILQMIGFKEFHAFLQLSKEDRLTQQGLDLFHKGVQDLKTVTRRYARRQERWIRNRFCSRPGPDVPPVYAVDSTDVQQWHVAVEEAIEIVRAFTEGRQPAKEPEPSVHSDVHEFQRNVCNVCGGKVFLDPYNWKAHLKTKKHKYNAKQLSKKHNELSNILHIRTQQLTETEATDKHKGGHVEDSSSDSDDGRMPGIDNVLSGRHFKDSSGYLQ